MLTDFDPTRCSDFNPDNRFNACHYFDPANNPLECGYCKKEEYYRCLSHNGQIPLSYSSVSSFLTCRYLYYLQAIRGIQVCDSAKSSPLKMGILWDAVIQKYYNGIDRNTGSPYNISKIITKYEIADRDVAKVRGLYRAYKMLEIQIDPDCELQAKIDYTLPFNKVWGNGIPVEVFIDGYYDRKYFNYFVENKLSGRPDTYLDPWFIQSQIGTYFLVDPTLEFCIMEVVRTPSLKSIGKYKEEDNEEYEERVYQDVLSRPSHYFLGYSHETHKYGKKFYRTEFNLEELRDRYTHIFREYWEARLFNGWYKNDRVCTNILPGIQCDMLQICRYNNMSETMYRIRQRPVTF